MNKGLEYSKILHTFICEMESTLNDKNKRTRAYAPQVFWKNKYTLELIETELKRLEELEKEVQLKSFAIETLNKQIKEKEKLINDISEVKLKQDEVLRIIKEKGVDVGVLQHCITLADYNNSIEYELAYKPLTQAEFDLLKESLK